MTEPKRLLYSKIISKIKSNKALIALLFVVIFSVFLIKPNKNFPLNDGWVHTLTANTLSCNKKIFYPDWLSPVNYAPIITESIIIKLFGLNFGYLQIANIIWMSIGLLAFYVLLRQCKIKPLFCFLLSLSLWFNPIIFNLAFTNMGDIPALAFLLLAMLFCQKGLNKNKNLFFFFGIIFALLSCATRQINVLFLISILIYLFFKKNINNKNAKLFIAILLSATASILFIILFSYGLFPHKMASHLLPEEWSYFKFFIISLIEYLLLLSLFISPFILGWIVNYRQYFSFKKLFCLVGIGLLGGYISQRLNITVLNMGNMMTIFGLGPSRGVLQGDLKMWGKEWMYGALHFFAFVIFVLILYIFIKNRKKIYSFISSNQLGFLFIYLALYILTISAIANFDRYLIMALPIALIIAGWLLQNYKISLTAAIALIIIFALYSIIGTYNYLQWNSARWNLAQKLIGQNVPASSIEGGYEWNGWNIYGKTRGKPLGAYTPPWAPWYVKELTPGHLMQYIISFSPLGGYVAADQKNVRNIWGNITTIYANKVNPGSLGK
ncbi:MAG: hypothetical protein V1688_03815 [bacterium]